MREEGKDVTTDTEDNGRVSRKDRSMKRGVSSSRDEHEECDMKICRIEEASCSNEVETRHDKETKEDKTKGFQCLKIQGISEKKSHQLVNFNSKSQI